MAIERASASASSAKVAAFRPFKFHEGTPPPPAGNDAESNKPRISTLARSRETLAKLRDTTDRQLRKVRASTPSTLPAVPG